MGHDDDRGQSGRTAGGPPGGEGPRRAANNLFLDDPPRPRQKRHKPAAGIISAGGVDMARAHASGIRPPREIEPPAVETRKVVVAVETDARKVPTHRKLLEGRDPGTRPALLPGDGGAGQPGSRSSPQGAARPRSPESDPAPPLPLQRHGAVRVAAVLVLLLLVAGVVRRVGRPPEAAPIASPALSSTLAPRPDDRLIEPREPLAIVSADPEEPPAPADAPPKGAAVAAPRATRAADNVSAAKAPSTSPRRKPRFKAPFQLPEERTSN